MNRRALRKPRISVFSVVNTLLLCIIVVMTIYPVLYILFASFSDARMLTKHEGPIFWPLGQPTLAGYKLTLSNPNILSGYKNTILYMIVGTSLNLVLTSLAAYALSRRHYIFRNALMIMIVITMFFGGGLVPLFFVIRTLGIYDTRLAVILPTAISSWNVILMRTFFQSLPEEMEESAIIDGANDMTILTRIILPLSKPIIAVMVLYYGVAHWNSWFNALVFLRDTTLFPLQLFLRETLITNKETAADTTSQMLEESFTRELVQYCTIVVSTFPIFCVYPFLQKYFVKGVMIGALKG
ncbi:carbohydrate ABC transporter permease [Ruminococcaceae bacterium OttesenSCG-928-L11]|nr:carbohydrate ABC transporter permease [Ruminococcaceae bacterium OttesenSCG-928-L11]